MNNLELLRNIVGHISVGAEFQMSDHMNYMSRGFNPLTKETYGLKREAYTDLRKLAKRFFESMAVLKRKVGYKDLIGFLTPHILKEFHPRRDKLVTESDVTNLHAAIETWATDASVARQVFVACIINNYPAASFSVGPVTFDFLDNFAKPAAAIPTIDPYPDMFTRMRAEQAFWMATVDLPGCSDNFGYELADLCVDLALTGFQLTVPLGWSRSVCRMDAKRPPNSEVKTTLANGSFGQRTATENAGYALGSGSIENFISDIPQIMPSSGNRIKTYLTSESPVPKLETAWCDGAYWFHEGVAEPVDSIATCKLETALEALLRGTSVKVVKDTLKKATRVTFEIDEDEPIFHTPYVLAKDFIEDVTTMRSRILHGTLSTLDTETSELRSQLEQFVGIMLQVYTLELDKYIAGGQTSDDLKSFFAWSEAHRASNPKSRFSKGWKGKE